MGKPFEKNLTEEEEEIEQEIKNKFQELQIKYDPLIRTHNIRLFYAHNDQSVEEIINFIWEILSNENHTHYQEVKDCKHWIESWKYYPINYLIKIRNILENNLEQWKLYFFKYYYYTPVCY